MKKLLLSVLSVMAMSSVAGAEVTLSVEDAKDFDGTLVEATFNEDGSSKAAQHYQPLNSLKIGDYSFTFTCSEKATNPAYYWGTTSNPNKSIRLYKGSTMTIAAPEGVAITGIEFKGSSGDKGLALTVDNGTISLNGNNASWKGSASKLALSTNVKWRVLSMTVYTDGESAPEKPDTPVTPPVSDETYYNYTLASKIESGKAYAFFASDSVGVTATKAYGYLYGDAVTEEDGAFAGPEDAAFTFEAVEGGYNIKDYKGRYMIMTGTYNSFNFADSPAENGLWSVDVAADGTATIVNLGMNKTMMWDHIYHSFGAYPADAIKDSMVKPVVYLQGDKASAPEKPDTPDEPVKPSTDATFEAASAIVNGSHYVMVIDGKYGAPIAESYSFGRLSLTDATVADGKVSAPAAAAITITEVEGKGYTMVDSYGRYLAMDATHFTSFQLYKEVNDGCYWTVEFTDEGAKIVNTLNTDCFVAQSVGNEGTFYTNIAPAKAPAEYNLPALYVETAAGIGAVTVAPANGEAAYFDIQGRRVAADALTPGLYIRRQGGKAVKVLIR